MKIVVEPTGFIDFKGLKLRCTLGRGGLSAHKCEGDGATPIGAFKLGRVFYRPDRCADIPITGLKIQAMTPNMGWCDDPTHPDYNQLIALPHPARHETLWREDHVYDVVVEILYNTEPIISGRGSAIFMHVAKPDYTQTEGCIALKYDDLIYLLRMCNDDDEVVIVDV